MALLTKQTGSNGEWEIAPEGRFQAVVADIVDLGWIEKTFEGNSQGLKPHVQFVFSIVGTDDDGNPVVRDDGKPFLVFGRRMVLSTHERAAFYKEICGIIGKKAVDAALEDGTLDTEDLIGRNVDLTVIHNEGKDGRVFANIESMMPWNNKYGAPQQPRDYVRRQDREDWKTEKAPQYSAFGPSPDAIEREMSAGPAEADERLNNAPDTRKQTAAKLAEGFEPGDDSVFDDAPGTVEEKYGQPELIPTNTKAKKTAAYAAGK